MKHTVSINQNYLFRRLYKVGKCYTTPYIALYAKKNRVKSNRLGVTVTKKLGSAVKRNRARRIISEAYRLYEGNMPKGYDYVIVARNRAVGAKMQEVLQSLVKIKGQMAL